MKLKSLSLRNFKGIKSFTLDAGCVDTVIFGDNATGKTTIADAVSFILTGKDSNQDAKFAIKTLNADGDPVHKLEHEVEAVFENGLELKLKKIYKETWTKKRGSLISEHTGNTTDHFIDDVPVLKKEYLERVTKLTASEETLRLLTSPSYFPSLHWEEQRRILLEVCGDITDEDVIASNPGLKDLPAILDGKNGDDFKKIVAGKRKKINETIKGIPARIDEITRSLPELKVSNINFLTDKLTELRERLSEKTTAIAVLENGGGVAELRTRIAEIDGELQTLKNKHDKDTDTAIYKKREQVNNLRLEVENDQAGHNTSVERIETLDQDIGALEDATQGLRDEFTVIDEQVFTEENCPTCGQSLPEGQAQGALEKFNTAKAETIEKIRTTGKNNNDKIAKLQKSVKEARADGEKAQGFITKKTAKVAALEEEIAATKFSNFSLEKNPTYFEAQTNRDKVEKEITGLEAGNSDLVKKSIAEKTLIEEEIAENEKHVAAIELTHKFQDRKVELEAEEKKLSAEFEELERHLFLIELFQKSKAEMLNEKISGHFNKVSFRLFEKQINEGLRPTCEVTLDNKPYSALNSGAKVHAGLDIIKTLSRHYKFSPVIFIDNCESVTTLPEMDTQVIRLIVSEQDKELRVVN